MVFNLAMHVALLKGPSPTIRKGFAILDIPGTMCLIRLMPSGHLRGRGCREGESTTSFPSRRHGDGTSRDDTRNTERDIRRTENSEPERTLMVTRRNRQNDTIQPSTAYSTGYAVYCKSIERELNPKYSESNPRTTSWDNSPS